MEEDSYVIQCKGAGGQSFGAFIPRGLTLELTGDSNAILEKDFPVENWLFVSRKV